MVLWSISVAWSFGLTPKFLVKVRSVEGNWLEYCGSTFTELRFAFSRGWVKPLDAGGSLVPFLLV